MSEPLAVDNATVQRYWIPGVQRAVSALVRRCPELSIWQDDLKQQLLMYWVRNVRQGIKTSRRAIWLYALASVNDLLGYAGGYRRQATHIDWVEQFGSVAAQASGPGSIALWRLQRAWPDMTALQRSMVMAIVTGATPSEVATGLGRTMHCAIKARRTALRRVNEPQLFIGRRRGPAASAEERLQRRREYQRQYQREYRARKHAS